MAAINNNYPESNNNEQIRAERQRATEEYIIDINNKLFELCSFLKLDIQDIKRIDKRNYQSNPFNDEQKKAIISAIKAQEEIEKIDVREAVRNEAMKAAGITSEDMKAAGITQDENKKVLQRMRTLAGINQNPFKNDKTSIEQMKDRIKSRVIKSGHGLAPPKTDWERVDVSKDEKNKILESIRANPKSSVFSKNFNWNPKDFLGAFSYLEEASEYNGPFIVSIVSDKGELEKYSKIPNISEGVSNICIGKFVLLSVYDITASSKEAKYIYIGLNYIGMTGRLEFSSMGSVNGLVTNSQKKIAMEYMDAMDIIYSEINEDLKIS
jgi:hypothetical protein